MALRRILAVVAIITALLLQLGVINALGLPAAPPNLLLVVVLVLALVEGPAAGMAYGFGAGLLGDALSTHTLGRLALVWTVAGFLAGLVADPGGRAGERSPLVPLAVVGALCAGATIGYAALDVVVGSARDSTFHIVRQALAVGVYGIVLTPFLYVALRAMLRRLDRART
jgi:rod shape-determining protein MreD